jgi:hypothetical protein
MSKIDLSVDEILKAAKPTTIGPQPGSAAFASGERPINIAPMNARIDFGKFLARPTMLQTSQFASEAVTLPETWSWRPDQIDPVVDVGPRLAAKKSITPILNQAMCGSCWAVALATAMSDCFVVAGKFLQLPPGAGPVPDSAISTTSILACYREGQAGCGGGNPARAAVDIQTKGVFGSSCYDYSWILNNNKFNGSGTGHFDAKGLESALANALPNCGCVVGGDRKKFTLKDVNTLPAMSEQNPDSPEALRNTWDTVRKWIWDNGSVVGGFVVYANFMVKNFDDTDGVYFEDYSYEGKPKEITGFHAVRIVGWGVQKKCKRPDGSRKDTPYWMVANSWGTKWGDKGYWKMARYPDNPSAQFDVVVNIQGGLIGGFIVFKAGNIFNAKIPQVQAKFQGTVDPNRLEAGFYKSDLEVTSEAPASAGGGNGSEDASKDEVSTEPKSGSSFLRNLFIGLIVIGIVAAIIYSKRGSSSSQFEYQYQPAPYKPSMRSIRI